MMVSSWEGKDSIYEIVGPPEVSKSSYNGSRPVSTQLLFNLIPFGGPNASRV